MNKDILNDELYLINRAKAGLLEKYNRLDKEYRINNIRESNRKVLDGIIALNILNNKLNEYISSICHTLVFQGEDVNELIKYCKTNVELAVLEYDDSTLSFSEYVKPYIINRIYTYNKSHCFY